MKKQTQTEPNPIEQTDDFKNMLDLLAIFSSASNGMAEMQSELNEEMLSATDPRRDEYSKPQKAMTEAESGLEVIALRHPEWFADRKSIKTPYGQVKFTRSTTLEVPNPEVCILLVNQRAEKDKQFDKTQFLRQREELNLEAFEAMSDEQLKTFRIKRVANENFSVSPAKVDLGKAVKEAAEAKA